MPRRDLVVTDRSPQEWLDYAIDSGAAGAVVQALNEPGISEHWLFLLGLMYVRSFWGPAVPAVWVKATAGGVWKLGVLSGLLLAHPKVRNHFKSSEDYGISLILDWWLQQVLFGKVLLRTVRPVEITLVPGLKIGAKITREPDLPIDVLRKGLFADAVAKVRTRLGDRPRDKRNGRPPWIKELSKELLMPTRSVQWHLQQYPDLRKILDEAAGAL